ncbi:MAG: ferredoxin [Paracoccaceae bacterium]
MPGLAEIDALAARSALEVFGAFHPSPGDGTPEGCATLVLLGPREPGFWPHVSAQPEFRDGAPDPLDRWSTRAIGVLAEETGATPLFPFTGPPWLPFYDWALRSGHAWASPVGLLVHAKAGLMASWRGALALDEWLELPAAPACPCDTCAGKPCLGACPVGALGAKGYDVPACHAFLDLAEGAACLNGGCRVRCACPVSKSYGRMPEQSAFHMAAFHR